MGEREPGNYFEQAKIFGIQNIAGDIAHRLYMRHRLGGREYIITDQPTQLLTLIQKRWTRLTHQALKKRRSATDTEQLIELSRQITYMQNLCFTEQPFDEPDTAIIATTYTSAITYPPICRTMYIAATLEDTQIRALTNLMPTPSQVVVYDQSDHRTVLRSDTSRQS